MSEKSPTSKIIQITGVGKYLYALCEDGSLWNYGWQNEYGKSYPAGTVGAADCSMRWFCEFDPNCSKE